MALWDRVRTMLAIQPTFEGVTTLQTRTIEGMDLGSSSLEDLLTRVSGVTARPWRASSLRDALGVPAIFGAVNLIANVTGSLSMKALRNEVELRPADRPRIIVRPDPFTMPREFYRMTAYTLASRGEAWWWVAARDIDDNPISVINVPPHEVTVEEDPNDLRYAIVKWRGKEMNRADFRQLVYAKEPGALRGHGPLQMCGAAVSVAVESQEWAANYYHGGGAPPLIIKTAGELGSNPDFPDAATEAQALRAQWMDQDPNTPRVIDSGIDSIDYPPQNTAGAQMLESRGYQNVEVATMFGMDATMLNAGMSGQSLTYQNVSSKFDGFLRQCLRPTFLTTIEQTMSDLLPRNTVAKFDTETLVLADIKTRYETYDIGIAAGIITPEQAQAFEGLQPGDVENAAVPFSPPQAIPSQLPIQVRSEPTVIRCDGRRVFRGILAACNKTFIIGTSAKACPRCKKLHEPPQVAMAAPVLTPQPIVAMRAAAPPTVVVQKVEPEPVTPPDPIDFYAAMLALNDARSQARMDELRSDFYASRAPENRTEVRIEQGAIQNSYAPPEVHVTVPERSVHVDGAVVNVPAQEPPVVNVAAAEAPVVTVNIPEQPAATVTVNVPEAKPTKRRIERDSQGRPSALIEEPI